MTEATPQPVAPIGLPVLVHLSVDGYGMFPGQDGRGLNVEFRPGLTLILGANGLGKSTLVLMLYRMLTGPFDIPGLSESRELGTIRLDPVRLTPYARGALARRVADSARDAQAAIGFLLGGVRIDVERRLSDLELTQFRINGESRGLDEIDDFQAEVIRLTRLGTFADWILMLRHLTFYFEERRALVWDPSAQRQLLRLLFLPATTATEWTAMEREILQLDSHMRNLSAALTREERELTREEATVESAADVREELLSLEPLQDDDLDLQQRTESGLLELDAQRQSTRLRLLNAEQAREAALRDMERVKLLAVGATFPSSSDTARYVLSQLMASDECLVCGHSVPAIAADLGRRIEEDRCVVCGSPVEASGDVTSIDTERVTRAIGQLDAADEELADARLAHTDAEAAYSRQLAQFTELGARIATRAQRVELLVASLPPDEAALHQRRSQISILRSRVEEIRQDLTAKRALFATFMDATSRTVVGRSNAIKTHFEEYARGFLMEECDLVWSPHSTRLGQTGEPISFPSFELSLTGSDFAAPVRRTGPEDVSESQREFIDLAFRMALMAVAGADGVGSIVIDAPESSLDAVFTSRAASVLGTFAGSASGNRLVLTSNLVEGSLIPTLVSAAMPPEERDDRLVDLLELAEPTAAVRELREEYRHFRDSLLAGQRE